MKLPAQAKLLEYYKQAHDKGVWFHGKSLGPHIEEIGKLIRETSSDTVLDYGCGKAIHYKEGLPKKWGVKATLYEPCVEELSKKPEGKFDGVICTDVLEHVVDVDGVLSDIFNYAEKFVFLSISCLPSKPQKVFEGGIPFHVTVKPPSWWKERIEPLKRDLRVELRFDVPED